MKWHNLLDSTLSSSRFDAKLDLAIKWNIHEAALELINNDTNDVSLKKKIGFLIILYITFLCDFKRYYDRFFNNPFINSTKHHLLNPYEKGKYDSIVIRWLKNTLNNNQVKFVELIMKYAINKSEFNHIFKSGKILLSQLYNPDDNDVFIN